jgi:hypothetical protein
MITVGFCPWYAASSARTETGISVIPLVLIAKSMHMALVATPGCLFSDSSSFIARSPKGVAALFKPRMFADTLSVIDPSAG